MHQFHEDIREGDLWAVHDNTSANGYDLREWAYGERHQNIMAQLEHNGIIHRIHVAMNSRCN